MEDDLLFPSFTEDFVILSEFCEQEGPIPLFLYPDHRGNENFTFDVNAFVLRTLTSDHTRKSDPGGCTGGWQTPEDTQVVMTEHTENAYAYVHYLTLHDVHARGYVRPVCLSYITADPDKIMRNFEQFLHEFSKISSLLKKGNNMCFLQDLTEQSEGLKRIMESQNPEQFPETITLSVIQEVVSELATLKKRFELENEELSVAAPAAANHNKTKHSRGGSSSSNNTSSYAEPGTPERNDNDANANSNHNANNNNNNDRRAYSPHHQTPPRTEPSTPTTSSSNMTTSFTMASSPALSKYMPIVLKSIHKKTNFDQKLRSLSSLCGRQYSVCIEMLKMIVHNFKKDSLILELEKEELSLVSRRSPASLLTIGRSIVLDFNLDEDSLLPYVDGEHGVLDLVHPTEITPEAPLGTVASALQSPFLTGIRQEFDSPRSYRSNSTISSSSFYSYKDALDDEDPKETESEADYLNSHADDDDDLSLTDLSVESYGTSQAAQTQKAAIKKMKNPKLSPYAECFVSALAGNITIGNNCYFASYENRNTYPGKGFFTWRHSYSFMKHLLYALLKGRPVIIYASPNNERKVRSLVTALSIFVPGQVMTNKPNQNLPKVFGWRTKSLQVRDLARFKLLGLSKKATIASAVEKYVSILDFDNQTLTSPPYHKGDIITNILSTKKTWPNEQTYLMFIHTTFLDLALKCSIYYHLHCVGMQVPATASSTAAALATANPNSPNAYSMPSPAPNTMPANNIPGTPSSAGTSGGGGGGTWIRRFRNRQKKSSPTISLQQQQGQYTTDLPTPTIPSTAASGGTSGASGSSIFIREPAKQVLKRLGFQNNDVAIVEYITSLIKEQQDADVTAHENSAPTIHLDFSPCEVFKNSRQALLM